MAAALLCLVVDVNAALGVAPTLRHAGARAHAAHMSASGPPRLPGRRALLQQAAAAGAAAAAAGAAPDGAQADTRGWQKVELPIATESPILFDIDYDPANPSNGFIVGNKGTFLQTLDGGRTWAAKSFANLDAEDEINYRFTKMSFRNGEGWIIGKPAILLHTRDSGATWERVPLSPKLPGDPYSIVALGP